MSAGARHDEADTRPVAIERSDALDAAGALALAARDCRRQARLRRYAGAHNASFRATLRAQADVYDAAAVRVQRACDEAM